MQITTPSDLHVHLRDAEMLPHMAKYTARQFKYCIVMPNLRPPITTLHDALRYRADILEHTGDYPDFDPKMTIYLTDDTPEHEIKLCAEHPDVIGAKLYPANATTNSDMGLSSFDKADRILAWMEKYRLPLLVHGEVTDPDVDFFDREKVFIDKVLDGWVRRFPCLPITLEHITTKEAVQFVESIYWSRRLTRVGATITAHHLLRDRNAIFAGGLRPHNYCLPIMKRSEDREALNKAARSGLRCFFAGTDSAPHFEHKKESDCCAAGCFTAPHAIELYAEAFELLHGEPEDKKPESFDDRMNTFEKFMSLNGLEHYGLEVPTTKVELDFAPWKIEGDVSVGGECHISGRIRKFMQGEELHYRIKGWKYGD